MAVDNAPVFGSYTAALARSVEVVLEESAAAVRGMDAAQADGLARELLDAERLFFAGEGRSGLVARMAAMRLVHLGLRVHVVGEPTAPALAAGDHLVLVSGSGSTGTLSHLAERAAESGGRVLLVTAKPDSPIGRMADVVVTVPAPAKTDRFGHGSAQFAGSLFEQAALLYFDALFHTLSGSLGKDAEGLWALHTNLE